MVEVEDQSVPTRSMVEQKGVYASLCLIDIMTQHNQPLCWIQRVVLSTGFPLGFLSFNLPISWLKQVYTLGVTTFAILNNWIKIIRQ